MCAFLWLLPYLDLDDMPVRYIGIDTQKYQDPTVQIAKRARLLQKITKATLAARGKRGYISP
jgi:hypothetical protein